MSLGRMIAKALPDHLAQRYLRFIFKGDRKINFYQRLKDGVANNQTITQTLHTLVRFYSKHEDAEEIIVQRALAMRNRGATEMEIFRDYITNEEQLIIRMGEQVGFGTAFDRCIELERRRAQIATTFREEMTGPAVRILLIVAIMIFIGKGIFPELLQNAKHDVTQGNIFTYILYLITEFVNSSYSVIAAAGIVGAIFLMIWSFRNWTGELRNIVDKIPPWSGFRIVCGSNWLSSISLMIASNMTVKDALEETCSIASKDNPWLYERIAAILNLYGPNTFGMSFVKSGFSFPDEEIVDEMEMYSEQNVPESRYLKLADDWSKKGVDKMKVQVGVLSKISQGLFYAVTITFVLGIYLFTQDATQALGTGA